MKRRIAFCAALLIALSVPMATTHAASKTAAHAAQSHKTKTKKTKTTSTTTTKKKAMTPTSKSTAAAKPAAKTVVKTAVKPAVKSTAKPKAKPTAKKKTAPKKTAPKKAAAKQSSSATAKESSPTDDIFPAGDPDPIDVTVKSESGKNTDSAITVNGKTIAAKATGSPVSSTRISEEDLINGTANDQVRTVQILDTVAGVLAGLGAMLRKLL